MLPRPSGSVLVLISLALVLPAAAQEAETRLVMATNVACRAAPDASSPVVVRYHSGDVFLPQGESGAWYRATSRASRSSPPGCWIHGSLTAPWSDREAALLAAADRILARTDPVPFEDVVAVVNLLGQTPAGPHAERSVLEASPRLQLRRLQLLERAAQAPGTGGRDVRRSPLRAAWFRSQGDALRYHEPAGVWLMPASVYWELHERHPWTPVAEEIAWAAANGPVLGDECDAICALSRIHQTYARYWATYPRGQWVDLAVEEARTRLEHGLRTGCLEGHDGNQALEVADAFRGTLGSLPAQEGEALLDLVIELEGRCGIARRLAARPGTECHALDIEDPGAVLFLLRQDVQGEVLVLTREPLEGSPGVTEGARAYLGRAAWHRQAPMRRLSWVWSETASETEPETRSIRVQFALPIWGILWEAQRTETGLEGWVTYHDDVPEGPPPTSRFTGTRVPC